MTDFASLGLAEPILRAIAHEGYTQPTPIQAGAIPVILSGRDLVGIAQTGTGKTAAFVLPLLNRLVEARQAVIDGQMTAVPQRACRFLILAPTRELATQIGDCIKAYGRNLRPSMAVIVGGMKPGPQVMAMRHGVEIVVATPGRLIDHMTTGAVRMDSTTVVVLDEADQMLDLGFMPAVRRIMAKLAKTRQAVLLSATMPKQIRSLADDFLNEPVEIEVTPQSRPVDRIDQKVVLLQPDAKRGKLVELLAADDVERSIVFTRTKRGADKVTAHLNAAGLTAEAIHGDKSQGQRDRALNAFRNNRIKILVATDIAARGIDVDGISHVINFELPNVPESYVHRIGRTARAGATGVAISLCDHTERPLLRDIERLIGRVIEGSPHTEIRAGGGNGGGGNGGQRNRNSRPRGNGGGARAAVTGNGGGNGVARPQGDREQVARPPRERSARDHAYRDSAHRDAAHREPGQRDSIHRGETAHRDAVHREHGHREHSARDGAHREAGHREGGHREGGHREGGYRDGGRREGGHREGGRPPARRANGQG